MDPANYEEHGLPKIEYQSSARSKWYNIHFDFQEFIEEFRYRAVNCLAITSNDEVIYNTFGKNIRDSIIERQILDTILVDPNIVFKHKNARTMIYLMNKKWIGIYLTPDENLVVEYYTTSK